MLIIADSGDNILNLLSLKPKQIVAIDIALKACFVNEIKTKAMQYLSFQEFRSLFAPPFSNPFLPKITKEEKLAIYLKIKHFLSLPVRNWLAEEINSHPKGFLFPNWRELTFAHLIPHFADERQFERIKSFLKPYSLLNLPIEKALKELEENYDLIYLSNIPEYIKQSLKEQDKDSEILDNLMEIYGLSFQKLKRGGYILFYSFGDALKCPELILEENQIAKILGLKLRLMPIKFSTPLIKDSCFVHTLGLMAK